MVIYGVCNSLGYLVLEWTRFKAEIKLSLS